MERKLKRNIIILIIGLAILAGIGLFLHTQTETVEFEEFSIEAPFASSFSTMIPKDPTVKEQHRCSNEDLTITLFDRKYIEDAYYNQTGEHIDYFKGLMDNITTDNSEISNISDNLTRIIETSDVGGYGDTDVACIYHDDERVIIVEGGDVEFITKTAESIKIL